MHILAANLLDSLSTGKADESNYIVQSPLCEKGGKRRIEGRSMANVPMLKISTLADVLPGFTQVGNSRIVSAVRLHSVLPKFQALLNHANIL
jgi:hypothetical protein